MIQPYGIQLAGDAGGLALVAFICWYIKWYKHSKAGAYTVWVIACVISAIGSLSLLPHALSRGDWTIFGYHLFWVLFGVVFLVDGIHKLRHYLGWTTPLVDKDPS